MVNYLHSELVIIWIALGAALFVVFLFALIRMLFDTIRRKRKIKENSELIFRIEKINRQMMCDEIDDKMRIAGKDTYEDSEEQIDISVRNVTMCFKKVQDEASSLKEYIIRAIKGQNKYEHFTALDDVSFDVHKGEVVGFIGTNGSGKSTLLKIISGVLQPTMGTVTVDKKKVQLLTLGTGFDVELTGRENVYLNGAIIGYTKQYIDEKYEDIVKFAELEDFMEEKVKNYSSGMVSRLAFAIATMRDNPEILILDEVLSVGDMFFRQKSEARIQEMIHSGSTVLMVSHSMETIKKNCSRAIWIEKGKKLADGDPETVCAAYAGK